MSSIRNMEEYDVLPKGHDAECVGRLVVETVKDMIKNMVVDC